MTRLDLGTTIQEAIARAGQSRIGDQPPVFVTLAPAMTQVPWKDHSAAHFVRRFVYETLLASAADAPVEVSLRRRGCLKDLNAFIGVRPSYWIQLRLTGRSLRISENLIDGLFDELGFRNEEWIGIEHSRTRIGIFSTIDAPKQTMVFCFESVRYRLKCDLLLPIDQEVPVPAALARASAGAAVQA